MALVGAVYVRVDVQSNSPVLLLQEESEPHRTLPIFIGASEASSIAMAQQDVIPPRPLAHDLLVSILEELKVKTLNVSITELREKVFYAELLLEAGGRTLTISARPSDAVAVAVRTGAPIYISDDLLEEEGIILPEFGIGDNFEPIEEEELIDQFQEFLRDVKPEDFTG